MSFIIDPFWSSRPVYLSRYSDWLRAGRSGDRNPVGAEYSAPVQTGPGAKTASYKMGLGSFPVGKERPGRDAGPLPPSSFFFLLWRCDPTRVMASSFLMFLDHTQRRTTVGRTSLDEGSARRRDLYLTTHNTHNR